MKLEISGLNAVVDKLENIAEPQELAKAMGKACALVERSAKQKAPKDTGALRNSITSKVDTNNGEVVGTVFTTLEYAPYVEYGTGLFAEGGNGRKDVPWAYEDEETGELIWTSGQHPHPYMRPALEENRENIVRLLGGSIDE